MNDLNVSSFNHDFVLKLFNLNSHDIESFHIRHQDNQVVVALKLVVKTHPCPVCLCETTKIKGYTLKRINHSILHTMACQIEYRARRYQCPLCQKTFYEHNPFTLEGMRTSLATVFNVLKDLKSETETFSSVAKRHHLSVTTVSNYFDQYVHIEPGPLSSILCIDEVYAFKSKNSQYVCVLLDYISHRVIDLLPSRRKEDLIRYLSQIDRNKRLEVKIVSIDMWETYRQITKNYFPKALCAVDKFHVLQEFSRALNRVRVDAMNQVKNQKDKPDANASPAEKEQWYLNDQQYYVFKKFNWLLFKTPGYENLDINVPKKFNRKLNRYMNFYDLLQVMLKASKPLREAYQLKQDLYQFYQREQPTKDQLTQLIQKFKKSNLEVMNKFSNTLVNWKQEILHSFIQIPIDGRMIRVNNALIENRNKTIKTIKRNSNGFTHWNRFRNRFLYVLNENATFSLYPHKKKGSLISK